VRDDLTEIEEKAQGSSQFTRQDLETIHKMIASYRSIMVLGKAGKFAIFILVTLAAGVTAWATLISKLKEAIL
jgi:hypothetical protein